MHPIRTFHETRQFGLGRLYHGKTGHLLLKKTVLDRVKQYEKIEIALGGVVMVDACLSYRPGPIRRSVVLFGVSNLVRDLLWVFSTDCNLTEQATLLWEPSLDAVLAILLEPLSARCGISPNENKTDRKFASTW